MIEKFIKERTGTTIGEIKEKIDEKVPTALAREFFFALGGIPLVCFVIQIVTGLILSCYFINYSGITGSGFSAAYVSVKNMTSVFPVLNYIRGIHQLSANIMIVSLFLHMLRVFFTESYRKPRELIWVCGMLLFFTTFGLGFTGYALVGDQLSYWATQVGTNIAGATPFIGGFIRKLMLAGEEINVYTLPRFFILHVLVLPFMVMIPLIGMHLLITRSHGISYTGTGKTKKSYYSLVPHHIFNEYKIMWVLLIGFLAVVYFYPPTIGEPANSFVTPEHIKPEWYFYPMFHFLKLVSFEIGIISILATSAIMVVWPLVQTGLEAVIPYKAAKVIAFTLGTGFMLICIVFAILEAIH
ncbi:MAG: cytochrome bc complex cytochrome b subunit [Candidatus Zixiibacteriota bacterium]